MTSTTTSSGTLAQRLVPVLALALLAVAFIRPLAILLGTPGVLSDFDLFHVSARAVLSGDAARLYDEGWYRALQARLTGTDMGGIWTYPPPFDLVIAPLGALPRAFAMLVFTGGALLAYLLVLRRLAEAQFGLALLLLAPMMMNVVLLGQNGLLIGALAGAAAIGIGEGRRWAGMPLGAMVIKPHLAAGLGLYALTGRDGRTVVVAAVTAVALLATATAVLGTQVWPAFLAGVANTGVRLEEGHFPFARMVSVYAALRSLGTAPAAATAAQGVMAVLAVAVILLAQRHLPRREALGIATIAGLLISPYAYDYDLPVAAVGLVLILPALMRAGRPAELVLVYAVFLLAVCWGGWVPHEAYARTPGLGGLAMPVVLALCCRILWRGRLVPAAPSGDQ